MGFVDLENLAKYIDFPEAAMEVLSQPQRQTIMGCGGFLLPERSVSAGVSIQLIERRAKILRWFGFRVDDVAAFGVRERDALQIQRRSLNERSFGAALAFAITLLKRRQQQFAPTARERIDGQMHLVITEMLAHLKRRALLR